MKKILLIAGLFISLFAGAQNVNQCGIIIPPTNIQPLLKSNFASVNEARGYVNSMLENVNWKENFTLREQNGINNAYATIVRGIRYIVYDNRFLESLDSYAGTKWASISVLAHEIGHHYSNHLVDGRGSTPSKEIEADYFSGYVLAKMGASLNEARGAMERIATPYASSTHPGRADRLNAIANGWNFAQGITAPVSVPNTTPRTSTPTTRNSNPRPAPQPQQRTATPANDPSWINLSVRGSNQMTVYLSDNGRTYTAVPLKTTRPFVFKFDVYEYGWLRLSNSATARTFRLVHGKDYAILFNNRTNSWTVGEVPRGNQSWARN